MDAAPRPDIGDDEPGTRDTLVEEPVGEEGDLWLAPLLIAFSLTVAVLSYRMPRPGGWLSAPGIFPLVSALIVLGLSLALLLWRIRTSRRAPTVPRARPADRAERRIHARRMLVAVAGILAYVFLLIPTVHFRVATFIYLVGTLWYFWDGALHKILLVSLIATLVLSEMFARFFQVMLP
jgi:hypothetical protein